MCLIFLCIYKDKAGAGVEQVQERLNIDYAMLVVKAKHDMRSLSSKSKVCLLSHNVKDKFPSSNLK